LLIYFFLSNQKQRHLLVVNGNVPAGVDCDLSQCRQRL
jgi:hypothetical protein